MPRDASTKPPTWHAGCPTAIIEYLGRLDHQVKIRGFRIELGEIETALREHASVQDVLVNPFGDKGEQRLCAYIIGDFDAIELRHHLAEKLPEYMVPAAFMRIEAIPLSPSGKADRKALPHPGFSTTAAYTAPHTETEQALCAIFAEVLGVDRIGIHDNFFESGGDSIHALQMVARARSRGIDIAVRDIFKAPDVEALSVQARTLRAVWGLTPEPVAPLTPIQAWFFGQEGDRNRLIQSMLVRVPVNLDLAEARSGNSETNRPSRCIAPRIPGRPTTPPGNGSLCRTETGLPYGLSPTSALNKGLTSWSARGIRPSRALISLMATWTDCVWFDCGEEPENLLLVIHHLAVDGVSWRILIPDLQAAYEGQPFPEKTTSWTSWATKQKSLAACCESELPFWRERLAAARLAIERGCSHGHGP